MPREHKKKSVPIVMIFLTVGFYILFQFFATASSPAIAGSDEIVVPNEPFNESTDDFDQEEAIKKLRERIKGRENDPAEKVFQNIQRFKGVPAGRVLTIMERGFVKYLGVSCTHCHVPDRWEKDDNPKKQISREMGAMTATINEQLLKNIKNLKTPPATINCMTCHQGQPIPPYLATPPGGMPAASPSRKVEGNKSKN